ncbi:monovalent cation/H+ antiporter complex subunit F [Clostridium grantii]|uniref:Multisubunit sodium/proton antiporter, MrpF subunit n=1 Tax=Clostridium grantii DSM 8605 TaxID=1121316 RepID=A0A1M5UIW4_9CLOT|nr:monovalent cation/H+ antiporter complex subunit F [Clostridium grantii]SHH62919.1 multisubunit sodium/proton antiporter, MrpF subunit [Clostridium grantii DSM 8605]
MNNILVFSSIFLAVTILLCMYRAVKGPSVEDILVAVNVVGTKTIVLILIASFIMNETYFVDVALVYALISFIASVVISKSIETEGGEV